MNNNDICQYDVLPQDPILARAYVPYQCWQKTYNAEKSLMYGTAFPELYSPYCDNSTEYLKLETRGKSNNE